MTVEVKDPRFADVIEADAKWKTISDALNFAEGSIWHPHEKHLTFSDIPENKLYRYVEGREVSVYREPSNLANGNTYDAQGRIICCEHATSRVVCEEDGELKLIASHCDGKELNSPNDIVVASDGSIYFTDPTCGRGTRNSVERDVRGVYHIETDG